LTLLIGIIAQRAVHFELNMAALRRCVHPAKESTFSKKRANDGG
jgi:hypothetical protein